MGGGDGSLGRREPRRLRRLLARRVLADDSPREQIVAHVDAHAVDDAGDALALEELAYLDLVTADDLPSASAVFAQYGVVQLPGVLTDDEANLFVHAAEACGLQTALDSLQPRRLHAGPLQRQRHVKDQLIERTVRPVCHTRQPQLGRHTRLPKAVGRGKGLMQPLRRHGLGPALALGQCGLGLRLGRLGLRQGGLHERGLLGGGLFGDGR